MKRLSAIIFLTISFLSAFSQVITDEMQHPEAIVSDGKVLYVGNFGAELAPTVKDTDGYISKVDFEGEIIEKQFIKGLSAPKGMCIVGKTLYLTDITVVKGFSLKSGKELFSIEIPEAQFLNDVTSKGKHTLYVSDSKLEKIFEIDTKAKSFKEFASKDTPHFTNGLCYSDKEKRLYVVGRKGDDDRGSIGYYEDGKSGFVNISDRKGSHDGVAILDDNSLIITDWRNTRDNGTLIKVDKKTGKVTNYPTIEKIEGSADFYFHHKANVVYIPALVSTKIYKFKLE